MACSSGGVGLLTRKDLTAKTVDAPKYSTFVNIVISVVTHSKSFVVACMYQIPGSCFSAFLDDFLFSVAFSQLSFPPSSSVESLMFMWIQIVSTKNNL